MTSEEEYVSTRREDMLKTNADPEEDVEWTGEWPTYATLPEHMRPGAKRYVEEGKRPGGFLDAVLCNNLALAHRLADSDNRYILHVYAEWMYNDIPASCWGSRQIVFSWIQKGGMNG